MVKTRPRIKYTKDFVDNWVLEEEYPTSHKFKDLSGQVFGNWEVLKYAGKEGKTQAKYFCLCHGCDEGNIQKVYGCHLKKGVTTSCGCERDSKLSEIGNRKPDEHHEDFLKTYNQSWQLKKIIRKPRLKYEAYCPVCDEEFSILQSSVTLKSGGCKCTMKTWNGFDYNNPSYFYIFKISSETQSYWKYGVTQKQDLLCRNFTLHEDFERELVFSKIIKDRWDTVGIEKEFKRFLEEQGCTMSTKNFPVKNGYTECYTTEQVTIEDLENLFWSLNPKVVPFCTTLKEVEYVREDKSLESGVIKYFNLNKKQRNRLYYHLDKMKISLSKIDLTDPVQFQEIENIILKISKGV